MSAALGNFISWSERNRDRMQHDPLPTIFSREESPRAESDAPASPAAASTTDSSSEVSDTAPPAAVETILEEDDEETGVRTEVEEEEIMVPPSDGGTLRRSRPTVTLAELEEERELTQRRTSACILLAVFVLFRLWIEAIIQADFGLLLLCLVGTSWTARFIRHNREREEELDRRIAAYIENAEGGTNEVNRADLRVLSFQAQLALAIMESQRNLGQGGFGHPDGTHGANRGVSDGAKEHWQHFQHKANGLAPNASKGGYGSVAQEDEKAASEEEVAHCSICLGEYEDGESLVRLPCSHVYHDECVSSWTNNHIRCPLCNFDLESASGDTATTISSPPEDSIV